MNIWEMDKLLLFLFLFIPGFVMMKVFDMIFPNHPRDFSKAWLNAVGFSAIHYVLMYFTFTVAGYIQIIPTSTLVFSWLVFIPAIYPVIIFGLVKLKIWQYFFIHPVQRPWDFFFWQGVAHWVLIHRKDGSRIAGKYDRNSFTSAFPEGPEILIEEVWEINEEDEFQKPLEPRRGAIILGNEIVRIDFFINPNTKNQTKENPESESC